ncbi:hypothetical protein [Streptomyces wuyuanensis]|uniref:hypothetical protein n=1 Tax=Streptomyces wuyuanensis TaxID=1196353 RepID=UPI0034405CBF
MNVQKVSAPHVWVLARLGWAGPAPRPPGLPVLGDEDVQLLAQRRHEDEVGQNRLAEKTMPNGMGGMMSGPISGGDDSRDGHHRTG